MNTFFFSKRAPNVSHWLKRFWEQSASLSAVSVTRSSASAALGQLATMIDWVSTAEITACSGRLFPSECRTIDEGSRRRSASRFRLAMSLPSAVRPVTDLPSTVLSIVLTSAIRPVHSHDVRRPSCPRTCRPPSVLSIVLTSAVRAVHGPAVRPVHRPAVRSDYSCV